MAAPRQNSPEILREEIRSDARRQSDQIIQHAQQEAETFFTKAAITAAETRQKYLAEAHAQAAQKRELILATLPVEVGQMRSARVEALLESVREEICRRLTDRAGFDYQETVARLAAEAIQQMLGSAFVVKLSAADRAALGNDLAKVIARHVNRSPLDLTISDDTAVQENGAIIEDTGGRQIWDNRLFVRLERLWPELRRQIAVQTNLIGERGAQGGAP